MKIGIISDTHDHVKNLLEATKCLTKHQVDLIYHCGDWVSPFTFEFFFNVCQPQVPVKGVFGNNEGDRYSIAKRLAKINNPVQLEQQVLVDEISGKKLAIYHGQDQKITESLIASGLYNVVFTGHTHESLIETKNQTLHVNPGTVSDGAWSKIIDNPTLAIYTLEANQVEIINFLQEKK